jgi:hypothetical protein
MKLRDLFALSILACGPEWLAAQTPVTFLEPRNFGSGSGQAIAVADLNGDGAMDVVVAGPASVTVFLGNGHGSFTAEPPIGLAASAVAATDLNGDGIPDLAIAGGTDLMVMFGKGNGTFGPPHVYPGSFTVLTAGDFNGDGFKDIAAGNMSSQVQIFFGSASGAFRAGPLTTVPTGNPSAIVTADFNRDGKADLAVTGVSGSTPGVAVLFGNGNGTFGSPALYAVTGAVHLPALVAADFSADGAPDLAYGADSTSVGILLNTGDGKFTVGTPVKIEMDVVALAAADLNGDGKLDLVAAGSDLAGVLLGKGDGTFQVSGQYVMAAAALAIADFNGDGVLDIAAASGQLSLMLGEGKGVFHSSQAVDTGIRPQGLAAGDLNQDGNLDLVVAQDTPTSPYIAVLPGNGKGGFGHAVSYFADEPTAVAVSDVNLDGKPDVVFLGLNCVGTLPNKRQGALGPAIYSPCFGCQAHLLVADFNGDGKPDVLAYTYTPEEENPYLAILLGNGDGTFQAQTNFDAGAGTTFAAADFNNDGIPDLVAGGYDNTGTYILLGNGDGTFGSPVLLNSQEGLAGIGDFNGDGNVDIALSGGAIYLGNGDGTFTPAYVVKAPGGTAYVGDFNGDGILDIIGVDSSTGLGFVLLGQGNGNFVAQEQEFVTLPGLGVTGKFDRDGYLDLAIIAYETPVWILLNTTAP